MAGSTLHIARLHADCRIARGHPNPQAAANDVLAAVRAHLPAALSKAFASASEDPSVWFVRRLDIALALRSTGATTLAAPRLASAARQSFEAARAGGERGQDVLRFDDRAHYVATFVADLVRGHAHDKWYYASFAGLRPLSCSAQIREALLRDSGLGPAVLARLAKDRQLAPVLRALEAASAERLLSALCASAQPSTLPETLLSALSTTWQRMTPVSNQLDDARLALQLAVEIYDGALPDFSSLLAEVRLLLRLAAAHAHADQEAAGALQRALRDGELAALASCLRDLQPGLRAVQRLATSAAARAALAKWLRVTTADGKPGATPATTVRFTTDHGIALLLIRELTAFGIDDAALRFAVLLRAIPRDLRVAARTDRTLLWLCGLDAPNTHVEPAASRAALAKARAQLAASGQLCGQVVLAKVAWGSGHAWLARDVERDVWLDWAWDRDTLYQSLVDQALTPLAEDATLPDLFQKRSLPPERDLADLAKPAPGLDEGSDLGATLVARAVLRAYSSRLRGFEWSSVSHLRRNLFPGGAVATLVGTVAEVSLSPALLAPVLSVCGAADFDVHPPWLTHALRVRRDRSQGA